MFRMGLLQQQCCYWTITLPILFLLARRITAQVTPNMAAMPSLAASPTFPSTITILSLPAATSSSLGPPMPSATDQIPPSQNTNNQQSTNGILNYYFLLLVGFVIIVALVWWSLIRRNRRKTAQSRNSRQSALARDLEGMPPGRRWGNGRFRLAREPAPEEGLDERGQAPPPYMPASPEAAVHPEASHTGLGEGQAIPLQDLSGHRQKPPEYDERPVSVHDNANIGPSTIPQTEPRPWYRQRLRKLNGKRSFSSRT